MRQRAFVSLEPPSETYRPEDAQFFALDKTTTRLTLKKELDRETVDNHQIRIICTNSENLPARRPTENQILTVDITVNDVNDNPPTFQYTNYAVGVSEKDAIGKTLLTLFATDPDLDDIITYFLLTDTIKTTGENIEDIKDRAFLVNPATGVMTLNFALQASNMKGFFEFKVEARDLVNHTDQADVKIYLVAEANRVTFMFLNDVETTQAVNQQSLEEIFSAAYGATCVVDEIVKSQIDGLAQDGLTDFRVHFVRDNQALEASEILL